MRFVARRKGEVLLDDDGKARRQRAVDAIAPAAVFGIGVMRVQERAAANSSGAAAAGRWAGRGENQQQRMTRAIATNMRMFVAPSRHESQTGRAEPRHGRVTTA